MQIQENYYHMLFLGINSLKDERDKMKAIVINTYYKQGSTGKLSYLLAKYIRDHYGDAIVCYGIGDMDNDNAYKFQGQLERRIHGILSRITGLQGCFSWIATRKLFDKIIDFKPDIVYLGNLHGNYLNIYSLYRFLKKKNIPIIQVMWDEYSMTGSCTFAFDCKKYVDMCRKCPRKHDYPNSLIFDTSTFLQKKKRKAYNYERLAFVGVPYTIDQALKSSLLKEKRLFAVDEAVDQIKRYFPRDAYALRDKLGIPQNNRIIINVCVYPSYRKGGKYYLELARDCMDLQDVTFVHVGFNGDEKECPPNFVPIGFVFDQDEMPFYYSLGDLFVCTSLAETQPNTALEALSCGTPICGFNIAGVPTCAEYPYGEYVEVGDIKGLKEVIKRVLKKTPDSIRKVREYAKTRFSIEDYNEKLVNIAKEMISR